MSLDDGLRRSSRRNTSTDISSASEAQNISSSSMSPPSNKRGRLQRGDSLTITSQYLSSRSLRDRKHISYVEPDENDFGSNKRRSKYVNVEEVVEDEDEDDSMTDEQEDQSTVRKSMRIKVSGSKDVSGGENRRSSRTSRNKLSTVDSQDDDRSVESEKSALNGDYWKINNEDDDEDDDDEEDGKKYSFRNRVTARRETLNVTQLGGDGGGYSSTRSKRGTSTNEPRRYSSAPVYRQSRPSYRDPQQRIYLGGKLSNRDDSRDRHRKGRHREHRRNRHRKHYDSSSESDSSDSRSSLHSSSLGDEDRSFRKHEDRRLRRELDSIAPINAGGRMGGSVRDKASKRDLLRADVNPSVVDSNVSFESVGGLDSHISSLKEMVVLPLLYPEVFERFDTQPPRGVLFVGPPGTGKTLTARALANSLTTSAREGGRSVSFFMRKGAGQYLIF